MGFFQGTLQRGLSVFFKVFYSEFSQKKSFSKFFFTEFVF